MENRATAIREHEEACTRVAGQFREPWLRMYARGKLRNDRVYPTAYELINSSNKPILDVGCGLGLLAFYLRERKCPQPVLGLDVDARKIGYGATIAAAHYENVELRFQDVQSAIPRFSGNVALFDVLHYLPRAAQSALLSGLAERVAPGGFLMIRDCPRDRRPRFWITWLAEKFAQAISWNINRTLHFPSRSSIDDAFDASEFDREMRPLWGASPFNNHVFIFRRHLPAAVRAAV